MCEDFMHGKDGDDATKCRRLINEVINELSKLHQPTVISTVCEHDWKADQFDCYGNATRMYCNDCEAVQTDL
jgi:hypothetical protein